MKAFVTTLSQLALGLVFTSIAAAQEPQLPGGAGQMADASLQSSTLPVAEAKKRYQAAQQRLQKLVKGGGHQSSFDDFRDQEGRMLGTPARISEKGPRDRIRAAVAEDFDARRQLQQAELAELEGRVARIKRAMEIRDAMRETLIDQRADELLDEIQEGRPTDKSGAAKGAPPAGSRGGFFSSSPGSKGAVATPPAENAAAAKTSRRLKELDAKLALEDAEANLSAAENLYDYAKKMQSKGYVTELDVDAKANRVNVEKLKVERAKLLLDAVAPQPASGDAATKPGPSAQRLLELDVDEAKANLDSAERAYKRVEKLLASAAVEQAVFDEQADEYKRAQIQLQRAKARLNAFDQPPADDGAKQPGAGDSSVTNKAPN